MVITQNYINNGVTYFIVMVTVVGLPLIYNGAFRDSEAFVYCGFSIQLRRPRVWM